MSDAEKKSDKQKDWEKVASAEQKETKELATETEEHTGEEDQFTIEHPAYKELEVELARANEKAEENWEKFLASKAELENMHRRTERKLEDAYKYGLKELFEALLPIVDSLEQGLQASETAADATGLREGMELTYKMFMDVLTKFSVVQLDPIGQAFDPQMHEAMSMQEDQQAEPGTVLVVVQKGYQLHDRIIRPARVIVAKNNTEETG